MPEGLLRKMRAVDRDPVEYFLPLGERELPLNPLIGQSLELEYSGEIYCVACGRRCSKSYNQGYCFPCSQRLAECDICMVRPERCHYQRGTCRDPEWAGEHCMQAHYVYLANSSGLKVGITRQSQLPTRWLDQGASQALPIFRLEAEKEISRYLSGLLETVLGRHVADKTDWRKLLKGEPPRLDLAAERDRLLATAAPELEALAGEIEPGALSRLGQAEPREFHYPVTRYPQKIVSLNFDKTPVTRACLWGIKGQYLILDQGVLNIRKFTGYQIKVTVP